MKLSVSLTAANKLRVTRILNVTAETPTVKRITFMDRLCRRAKPGQFIMLWIPSVDEIPLSILDVDERGVVSVAVKKVGDATEVLHYKKPGEAIGVRGPFGKGFSIKGGKILMIGGGTGSAPLYFLAKTLKEKKVDFHFILGAKNKDELLLLDELLKVCGEGNLSTATEDGSSGFKGLATQLLQLILSNELFDRIYACGPEPMIREVYHLAEKCGISFEASLERLMRCAIGLCGSCIIGPYRVCRDGPVFTNEQLRIVENELGRWRRGFDGRRTLI